MLFKKRSKTFCVVPWTQVATNASGNYRVCCNSVPGKNFILDEHDRPMKVYKHSLDEVWNSPSYVNLREQFLKGERPEMCQRCFREEDSGVKSARQSNNESWKSKFEAKSSLPIDVKYIDIRLGNLCNLKCRMCNPYASSKWVDSWNQVVGQATLVPNNKLSEEERKRLKRLDWPENPQTWKNLEPILSSLEEIYLTGGEPFLSLEQTRFLNYLIEKGFSQNIILKYNTNLTVLPPELSSLWPKFKKVRLNVSIDGYGPLDEYIRFPTKWSTVEGNLQKIVELKRDGCPIEIGTHITVQMYNILSLVNLMVYLKENFNIEPYLNILNHPYCLNIRTLPEELKAKAEKTLDSYRNYAPVAEVISYMNKESWYKSFFKEFIDYTLSLDKARSQNLFELVPEFKEFCDGS